MLTLWEDEFSGAFKDMVGYQVEGLRVTGWGCHNVDGLEGIATSLTYGLAPVVEPEPVVDPIIEIDPIVEIDPIIEPEPVPEEVWAMLYSDPDCFGNAHKIKFPTDGSTEVKLDWETLVFETDIGDNSLSSVAVPAGYELEVWQHDYYGDFRIYSGNDKNSLHCQNIEGEMDNEVSAVTFRKSFEVSIMPVVEEDLPVSTMPVEEDLPISTMPVIEEDLPVSIMPVEEEPEPVPEPANPSSNFPELASENQAYMFSEPDCGGESWAVFPLASGEPRDIYYQDWEHLVGHMSHDNVASVQVPEGWSLTLWEHDFYGAAEVFDGRLSNLDGWLWACQNVGQISDMASSLTYEQL